ncbi:MAG: diaminopimelate epimerase [Muribaculaceae bacterium]|nr:diaminopimelate epimerase [Muribaculaceae bacterium]
MIEVSFTKMHGLGNDYIYFTEMPCPPENLPRLSRQLSDRHCGIGGDGIILALPSEVADFRMRIFNADGSEAKMCGNGSRCVGKLVYDLGLTDKTTITLETLAGIKTLRLFPGPDGKIESVEVDMGIGSVSEPVLLSAADRTFSVHPANIGNPHGVTFIDCDPAEMDVCGFGPALENDPYWPDRANIEFARVIDRSNIRMRVWERGSGETQACGTGACAVALAAVTAGLTDRKVNVTLPGGTLKIEILPNNKILMTGPATTVFRGSINI